MAAMAQEENHAIIKFCVDVRKTPTETMKMMKDANRSSNVSGSLIFKWHKRFLDSRESLKDNTGRRWKRIVNARTVAAVKCLIKEDHRLTVSAILSQVGISYGSIHSILRNPPKMTKVHARWVPRLLKDVEKEQRVQDSLAFLWQCERQGDAFLDRIITTDETWLWFIFLSTLLFVSVHALLLPRMGLAISLVATVKEKVWYHSNCRNRGVGCYNTNLTDRGGCCIWYNEPQLLCDVEDHLDVTIEQIEPDLKVPINEFDGKVTYGQKRKNTGSGYKGHVESLAPAVMELAKLEKRAQTSYIDLKFKRRFART